MTGEEFLQTVEKLSDVRRIVLAPGDTIVLFIPERLSSTAYKWLSESMEGIFPGHRVIVLESGMDMCVVSDLETVTLLEPNKTDS